jgi:predicted DNA-binding protein
MAQNRLNLVLKDETRDLLNVLAEHENKYAGTLARELIENALEEIENRAWLKIAISRQKELETTGAKYVPWSEVQEMFKDKK